MKFNTSDVLAGFMISISYLIIYTSMINKFVLESGAKTAQEERI